jgi:hypothetical protein
MLLASDSTLSEARLFQPGGGERKIAIASRPAAPPTGEVASHNVSRSASGLSFETECKLAFPKGAAGKLLLLLQFPGREHRANHCQAFANGKPVPLEQSSSENRIGTTEHEGTRWKEVLPHLSEWTWHICNVPPETTSVRITGAASTTDCRIGIWLWADQHLKTAATAAGIDCPEPQLPSFNEYTLRQGTCLRQPA